MRRFNPEKELSKIQHGNKNKIVFGVIALLLIISIGSSYALYQVRYSKRIIFTKVAPFNNKDLDLAVYVNGVEQNKVPEKDEGYKYVGIECDDGFPLTEWDEDNWNFKQILNINVPNKCNVYFSDIIQEYTLTRKVEEYEVPKDGRYKLEVWGAQGGAGRVPGGLGGYSVGDIYLTKGTKLYVVVGGAGSGNGAHVAQSGGYNGGGNGILSGDTNSRASSGGGATHIAISTGLLSTLKNNRESILIVAGGGAGSGFNAALTGTFEPGNGGGTEGGTGHTYYYNYDLHQYGYGGTQEGGGSNSAPSEGAFGTFGLGASCTASGGGGGYYGGGCYASAAGGGSGYLNSEKIIEGTTKTINGVNEGNGKARISYMGE